MKKLCTYANEYVNQADWKDLALVKVCLCATGVILGLVIPKRFKKPVLIGVIVLFICTYIPLMLKFIHIILSGNKKKWL